MLSRSQRESLGDSATKYHRNLMSGVGQDYLASRCLTDAAEKFGLGVVSNPTPGHEMYRGMLSIPYVRFPTPDRWIVVSIRFRCIREGCTHDYHGKYNSLPGDSPRLYNTRALTVETQIVALCEGELDTISAELAGIPAVGVSGAEAWKPHFADTLLGYKEVVVLADGDDAGKRFASYVQSVLPNARVVQMPGDVNSVLVSEGRDGLRERIGL